MISANKTCLKLQVPASEKSRDIFLLGLDKGISSTQLYTYYSCYQVSYWSIQRQNRLKIKRLIEIHFMILQRLINKNNKKMQKKQNQGQKRQQTFLIIIYGLPASGKSTFAQKLKQLYFHNCIIVSSDIIQYMLTSNPQLLQQMQKISDEKIVQKLLQIQKKFAQINKKSIFTPQKWKKSRNYVQMIIPKILKYISVILEDDLLLNSQRKKFRKISHINKIKYIEILMKTSIQQCISNLHKRNQNTNDCIVTEDIIKKSSEKLQVGDNPYNLQIQPSKISEIVYEDIQKKLQIVQIIPNDPNDPNDPFYQHQKHKYEHNASELIELQTRKFVSTIMKMPQAQFSQKFKIQNHQRNKLGCILSNWKKLYLKSSNKSIEHTKMEESLKQYLKQTN